MAQPNPLTDINQGWYLWRALQSVRITAEMNYTWEFDIRTARVVRGGFRLVGVLETGTNPGPVRLSLSGRMLWQID